jgi:hypothetical protein
MILTREQYFSVFLNMETSSMKLSHLPQITQLGNDRAEAWTKIVVFIFSIPLNCLWGALYSRDSLF